MGNAPAIIGVDGKSWAEVTRTDPLCSLERCDAEQVSAEGRIYRATFSRANIIQAYPAPGGGEVLEWRGDDEVFHGDSIASGPGRAITLLHPKKPGTRQAGLLTTTTALGQARGAILTFERVDDLHTGGTMSVWDATAIAAIERRVARQISLGYRLKIDPRGGKTDDGRRFDRRQTRIRINHAAIEPRGKAGSAVIHLDSAAAVDDLTPYLTGPPPASPVIFDFGDFARLDSLSSAPIIEDISPTMTTKYAIDGVEHDLPEAVVTHLTRVDALATKLEGFDLDAILSALTEGKAGRFDSLEALGVKLPESKEYIEQERTDAAAVEAKHKEDLEQQRVDAGHWAKALSLAERNDVHGPDFDPAAAGIEVLDVDGLRRSIVAKVLGKAKAERCDAAPDPASALWVEVGNARDELAKGASRTDNLRSEIINARKKAQTSGGKPDPILAAQAKAAEFAANAHRPQ